MFENPRRGRQARNFTKNVPKILDLKSPSEQIFSETCLWVPLKWVSAQDVGCCSFWFTEIVKQNSLSGVVTVKSVKCWKALSLDVKLLKALLNWFRKRHMLRAPACFCLWRFVFRTSLIPKGSPICHYLRQIKKVCALHFFLGLHV